MENKNEQFETADFYISSYLLAKNVKLLGVRRDNPRRLLFIFEDHKNRQKMVEDFLLDKGLVKPKKYASAIKQLKDLIHSSI